MGNTEDLIISLTDCICERDDASLCYAGSWAYAGISDGAGFPVFDGLFRWQAIDIPQGVGITSATLKLRLMDLESKDYLYPK